MRSQPNIPPEVIAEALEPYLREVERIKRRERMLIRKAITQTYQEEGLPVPEGAAMEAQIDQLEMLLNAGQHHQEKVLQLLEEMVPVVELDQQCLT